MSATVRSERVFRPRPNTASFLQQEVEDRVGEQAEDEIIEGEDEQPARLERLGDRPEEKRKGPGVRNQAPPRPPAASRRRRRHGARGAGNPSGSESGMASS